MKYNKLCFFVVAAAPTNTSSGSMPSPGVPKPILTVDKPIRSSVNLATNNGTVSGGGGGGGSGAARRTCSDDGDGGTECDSPLVVGAAGAVGGLGATGGTGSTPGQQGICLCTLTYSAGSGGPGGDSIDKNGRTVAQSGSGTYNGNEQA